MTQVRRLRGEYRIVWESDGRRGPVLELQASAHPEVLPEVRLYGSGWCTGVQMPPADLRRWLVEAMAMLDEAEEASE